MECPKCGKKTTVRESHNLPGSLKMRRRICKNCGCRFKTIEKIVIIMKEGKK